jgi:hypothetical protein
VRAADAPGGDRRDLVEPHVLGAGERHLARGELDHVGDQPAQLLGLLAHVFEQPPPRRLRQVVARQQHLDVGAQAGDRRPQLVRRVGDQPPLRLDRALERVEHRC